MKYILVGIVTCMNGEVTIGKKVSSELGMLRFTLQSEYQHLRVDSRQPRNAYVLLWSPHSLTSVVLGSNDVLTPGQRHGRIQQTKLSGKMLS